MQNIKHLHIIINSRNIRKQQKLITTDFYNLLTIQKIKHLHVLLHVIQTCAFSKK